MGKNKICHRVSGGFRLRHEIRRTVCNLNKGRDALQCVCTIWVIVLYAINYEINNIKHGVQITNLNPRMYTNINE